MLAAQDLVTQALGLVQALGQALVQAPGLVQALAVVQALALVPALVHHCTHTMMTDNLTERDCNFVHTTNLLQLGSQNGNLT